MGIVVVANIFRVQIIEDFVLKLLNVLVGVLGNYGLAIIATTLIVKAILYPLAVKQERSMAKVKLLQPKIDEINKKYKGDKTKISQETAALYKENNTNPLGGCLPILIQLPIFVALYYTFTGSAIPKDASFLWFNLTQPDKLLSFANPFTMLPFIGQFKNIDINILPILSGILMVLQQKLMMPPKSDEPSAENSMQSAMMAMPVMMTFLFYTFPSGVNLYYVLNTLISILQQRYIQNKVKKEQEMLEKY